MDLSGHQNYEEPPKYGLKLPLNHEYTEQSKQLIMARPKQILGFLPLLTRYLKYYVDTKLQKKRPIMDYINTVSAQRIYGCPIGGIGGGTIGRGYKGEFCRFQLLPGIYEYFTVPECQFIVNIRDGNNETIFQSVLSTYSKPKTAPPSWQWNLNGSECNYTGLYPRAWTVYDLSKYGVKLVCRQISPVIPHNYKDSSLPCAVFVFSAKNVCNEHRHVSVTFAWTEIVAPTNKKNKGMAKVDLERYSEDNTCGVSLEQKMSDSTCAFTIAKKKHENESIHEGYCLWSKAKTSKYIWDCLWKHGKLYPDPCLTPPPLNITDKTRQDKTDKAKQKLKKVLKCDSMALSNVISLNPGAEGSMEFCLAWDMPLVKYKSGNKIYKRYYTKYFGSDGIAGASMAAYALRNYKNWEKQLDEWQNPILNNSYIPDWLKGALMNELYFIADGGTIWFDVQEEYPETDPRHSFGLFAYLEGHEYRMYNTYDVHFYASFALAQLWPNLQVVLQYMFRDTIAMEDNTCRKSLYNGKVCKCKIKDSIPHDLGDPEEAPLSKVNAYNIHDVSEWRDLNVKFVLQAARDHRLLRAIAAPFDPHRYRSMAYIDDFPEGEEDDLYSRCVEQPPSPARVSSPTNQRPASQDCHYHVGDILDLLYNSTEKNEDSLESAEEEQSEAFSVWEARRYLADVYEACAALVRRSQRWDADGDGLIENGGFPDQTYDTWVMSGPSAYCGGLWVAGVWAARRLAAAAGRAGDAATFSALLDRAAESHRDVLWAGDHYRFDTKPDNSNVIMADQLAGQWYLRACGCTEQVFPDGNVKKALATIYENNVLQFCGGRMGAVNGWEAGAGGAGGAGGVATKALQSEEVWTGVTYGLAALMIYEGMHEEAFVTAGGLYHSLVQMGLAFETPEALYANGNHRAVGYMRPLAIWAMYHALITCPPPPNLPLNGPYKWITPL